MNEDNPLKTPDESIPEGADKETLEEIVQKDSKTGRAMTGLWYWITGAMGVYLVFFYMYCAAEPVDTQYFLGVYVLITYMMVFLQYPATAKPRQKAGFYMDSAIPFVCLGLLFYFLMHFLAGPKGILEPIRTNWLFLIISALAAAAFFLPIKHWGKTEGEKPLAMDIVLTLGTIFVVGYYVVEYEAINYRMGSETPLDTAVSVTGILISLEVARRVLGWSMTIVGTTFLLYAFWGDLLHHVPILDAFAHTGFALDRTLNHIYMKQEGVFGIMATVLVTYVILFIFFGAFLKASGASRFFLDLPMALAGRTVGGPAKVAVMASGFFGSVSGSAIANTVSTGTFTIPLMKKAGFRPHVAGAIEPSASIGGMFMPPIMGAGGFIMAEMTEIPYVDIMLMAVFPAVIYFLSVFVMIHFEAKRYGLVGIRDEDAPTALRILKEQWLLSLPLVTIVVMMLMDYSPGYAAYAATVGCAFVGRMMPNEECALETIIRRAMQYCLAPLLVIVVVCRFYLGFTWLDSCLLGLIGTYIVNPRSPNGRMKWKDIIGAMIDGSRNTLIIGATVGVIGIIVGTIQLTGIGLKFSQIIIELSMGYLPLAIILIGLASLVLGMGVPVTAAYLITAVLAVGAVTDMMSRSMWGIGFQELQLPLGELLPDDPKRLELAAKVSWALIASHMIVYWFSQDSNITPPVCVAAYAGAAIAGSDPWKTGWTSFKFAKMLYIGPFLFAFSPAFLLGGPGHFVSWGEMVMTMGTIVLATIAFGSLTMGYFLCPTNLVEWAIFALATALLFFPKLLNWATGLNLPLIVGDVVGIGLWVLVYFMQKLRIKRNPDLTLPIYERLKKKTAGA